MSHLKFLPHTAFELIDELDATFPDRRKTPEESLEEHVRYAGKRDLVEWLIEKRKLTEDYALKSALEK